MILSHKKSLKVFSRLISRPRLVSWSGLYVIILLTLFTASLVIEKGFDVLLINSNHTPFLDYLFRGITDFGNGAIFVFIIIATLFIRFEYGILAALIALLHGVLVSIFKRLLFHGLDRPVKYLHDHALHFVPGIDIHNINTFPSGHTATAFSAALLITLVTKKTWIRMIALLLALLVAYSRIYLLQHFLIDVAAGATIGWFSTYSIWRTAKLVQKPEWVNRKIEFTFRKPHRAVIETLEKRKQTIADTIAHKH